MLPNPALPRSFILALLFLFALPTPRAQEVGPASKPGRQPAVEYMDKVYRLYDLPWREGFQSCTVKIRVTKTSNPMLSRLINDTEVVYDWRAPQEEKTKVHGLLADFKDQVVSQFVGLWQNLGAGGAFALIKGKTMRLDPEKDRVTMHLALAGKPWGKLVFAGKTKKLILVEKMVAGVRYIEKPDYRAVEGKFRLIGSTIWVKGRENQSVTQTFGGHKRVNGFLLPLNHTKSIPQGDFAYALEYTMINGQPAFLEIASEGVVKGLVREYTKGYAKWSAGKKILFLQKLEDSRHELAAKAIAKKSLREKDQLVRKTAIETLGNMRCRNIVGDLIKQMKKNQKTIALYLATIDALGNIGDPKAVTVLSKDFWNQKGVDLLQAATAKIGALGKIRSKKSVAALMSLLCVARPREMVLVAPSLRSSLKKLTGQDFGLDVDAWKDWWRRKKAKFKLEED